MLGNFTYCNPTKLYFGDEALENLAPELENHLMMKMSVQVFYLLSLILVLAVRLLNHLMKKMLVSLASCLPSLKA